MSQKREKKIRRLERRIRDLEDEVKFLNIVRQMEAMDASYDPIPRHRPRSPGFFKRLYNTLFYA